MVHFFITLFSLLFMKMFAPPPPQYRADLAGRLFTTLLLCSLTAFRSLGQTQLASATSPPHCYTTTAANDSSMHRSQTAPGTVRPAARSSSPGPCGEFAGFAPVFYAANGLPPLPIKTVRIMFHVIQKNDGSENYQSAAQDGLGLDEDLLRAYVGSTNPAAAPFTWPRGSGLPVRSTNDVYRGLQQRLQWPVPTPTPDPPLAPPLERDTRIQFEVVAVRYYRDTYGWDMSNVSFNGCGNGNSGLACMGYLHDRYITNTATNPGTSPSAPNQGPLSADEQANVIHVFFGEHPGTAASPLDQYGVRVCRYQAGGAANEIGGKVVMIRGGYWSLYHHPLGGIASSASVAMQHDGFKSGAYLFSHELGHCLGLVHTFDSNPCVNASNLPPTPEGESNNIMDYPRLPGLSLSQCQIGEMHDALSSGMGSDVSVTQVRDHWTQLPGLASAGGQDNHITSSQTWNTIHNLRGNLYVENGAILTIKCRVGFLGSVAKIVVQNGCQLILDGGTIGNYATGDLNEAPQNLRLLLGGDAGDSGNNGGLITWKNAGCQLTSGKMTAELVAGATLHVEASTRVAIQDAHFVTRNGSYLCVEPGATFRVFNTGTLVQDPGTTLGVRPGLTIVPTPTCVDACTLAAQLVPLIEGPSAPVCSGGLTLSLPGASLPGYAYQWLVNGTAVAGATTPSLSQTLTNAGTGVLTYNYSCVVQLPGGGCPAITRTFSVQVKPNAVPLPTTTTAFSLCVRNALYILADFYPQIFGFATPPSGTSITWQDDVAIACPQQRGGPIGGGPVVQPCVFNSQTARLTGTRYVLHVCNATASTCPVCQDITITLVDPPGLEATATPATVCPGQGSELHTPSPAFGNVSYTWQPGNLRGSTVSVTPTVTTTYTVTATGPNGCTSQQTVQVRVRPATCPVCSPSVQPMPPDLGSGFTFQSGNTYYFKQDTRLRHGIYVAEKGAKLVFDADVTLTLADDAGLVLEGATLTATCDEQWGGIVVEPNAGIIAFNVSSQQNEISHSHVAIDVNRKAVFNGQAPWSSLHLDGMRFLHNMRGLHLPGGADRPDGVRISDCLFDSDPAQMLAPYAYRSPTQQFCSYYHLNLNGDLSGLKLQGNQLKHALFGILAPDGTGLNSSETIFTECHIMGAMAYNQNSPVPSTWTENEFTFAPRNNPFINPNNPFVAAAYDDLAQLGDYPDQVALPGACTGLFASGEGLRLEGTRFWQSQPLIRYNISNPYPQIGLWAGPNTTYVHDGYFQNLQIGYVGQAQQYGGEVNGNTFDGCRTGVAFYNRDMYAPVGSVALTCNTFSQPEYFALAALVDPQSAIYAAYGIELGPQPANSGNSLGGQVDISTDPNSGGVLLQTNRFTNGAGVAVDPLFWHVYNAANNAPLNYVYYTDQSGSGRVADDATNVGYYSTGQQNTAANRVQLVQAYANSSPVLLNNPTGPNPNDCTSRGYPDTGLQARPAAPPPAAPYSLAQNVPNPCSGSTQIAYRLLGKTAAQLVIRDTYSGRVWQRETLSGGERTVEVNLRALPAGAYIYTLEVEGVAVAHKRLLVQ